MVNSGPKESIEFPGFYEIPGYSKYLISKEGRVINKQSKTTLSGSIQKKGYVQVRITNDAGRTLTWGRHRLLGFVFKHPKCFIDKLVVNHINGIPGSDDLDNLEWTTHQGNIEHAGKTGLTEKCTPVSVRDVSTGEVRNYPSIAACARVLGYSKDKINWRVKVGETRVFPEGKQYRLGKVNTPWFIPENSERALLMNFNIKKVLIRYVLTSEVKEFPSVTEAAIYLNLSKATVSTWARLKDQPVLPGLIQIKFANDQTTWRNVSDPYLEYEMYSGVRPIVVREIETGKETIFLSSKECGLAMGLLPSTLYYRLKSKGRDVYIDGCTYAYYSDVILV